jgi:hypothetical protein
MRKAELRNEIRTLTEEYLMSGGEIEMVPPRRFLAPSCGWMEKYGWDYMPWERIGDDVHMGKDSIWLGEGGYLTRPQNIEE